MTLDHFFKLITAGGALCLLAACGNNENDADRQDAAVDASDTEGAKEAEAQAGEATQMETADDRISYLIGYQTAQRFTADDILSINDELLIQGIRDALADRESAVSQQEAQAANQELQRRGQERQAVAGKEAKAAGEAFLAVNKDKPGVVTTESGLQYKVVEEGEGEESPEATDRVTVHYTGTLVDGTKFDSSVDRGAPASFALNGVIPGWTEGLQLMTVGDKYRFFIPSGLAYGANPPGPTIPPNATLIFDVELLEIQE